MLSNTSDNSAFRGHAENPFSRFDMLATALAGRRMYVVGTDHDNAFADGTAIFLPTQAQFPLLSAVVVQAALLSGRGLDARTIGRLIGRRQLRSRYLTLEVARAIHQLRDLIPPHIARQVQAVYAGEVPESSEQSLAWASAAWRRIPMAPDWYGTIRPMSVLAHGAAWGGKSPSEGDLKRALKKKDDREDAEEDKDEDGERSELLSKFSGSAIQNPLLGRFLQSILGGAKTPAADNSGAVGMSASALKKAKVGANARHLAGGEEVTTDDCATDCAGSIGKLYPEWDCHAKRYRLNHCTVADFAVDTADAKAAGVVEADRKLLRQLAKIGLRMEWHRAQPEGDNVDVDALINYTAARAAGAAGEARHLYEARRRTARDLGVLILLDISGSTEIEAGATRVFDEQRKIAARLTGTFDQLGDRVATYAFYSSGGASSVRCLQIKSFDERYGAATQTRLAALKPTGFTRIGAAVRHARQVLANGAGTQTRLLIVIGDGLPFDDGYEGIYAQTDSHKALTETLDEGIGCIGISVGSTTNASVLNRVWGGVQHDQLRDASDLSERMYPALTRALQRANSTKRRIHV
jgi:nitric oxide reductase NorD protein